MADITYVPTWTGFLFLAMVLDVHSRRIVGWAMATHLKTDLVLDALQMAVIQRRPQGVIHHSDQGCQHTALAFGHSCELLGVRRSRGSVGDAYDNAMAESSSPPSSANCSTGAGSGLRPRAGWPSSATSRAGTTRTAGTALAVTCDGSGSANALRAH